MDKNKILFVGAMQTELVPLIKSLGATQNQKLLGFFPFYKATHNSTEIYIVETFVGETNASIATFEAIQEVDPDLVIKFGCVGGSYAESKKGDVIVPLGFFHRTSWITRTKDGEPTKDSSLWQSVFGELPHQVNSQNLGGLPYFYPANKKLINVSQKILADLNTKAVTCYVGGGNIWAFSQEFLKNMAKVMLPKNITNFVSDMESYSVAHACYILDRPFFGCYVVASNDYTDEPYNPENVSEQSTSLVSYALKLVDEFNQ
ncbi:hypothetical protein A2188_02800 [Candidatus Woesebacteria bacterium RIFOXYA1_FULL_43_9]|uniref:Nucleoside phosphorylase domain-containing protein n=1 Tax=Candidatus Woesebacteria bacterium RIFOXYA1_FULL_43_9 TaxID=1802534 RepID=A0A1F8CPT4_9BACT|nr:MAG: hypothetical protein A2188_02800 [Candidatus Woesebacteria bacterium RIFOXYA1_FULL_43_9]